MPSHSIFREIRQHPSELQASAVIVRLLDGVGFRFYWATDGLRPQDYAFQPGEGCATIAELLTHICRLANWMCTSVRDQEKEDPPESSESVREHILLLLEELRMHFNGLDDAALSEIKIKDKPFWNLLNGPMADILTHVGQINSLRRLAGNPCQKLNPFSGTAPKTSP